MIGGQGKSTARRAFVLHVLDPDFISSITQSPQSSLGVFLSSDPEHQSVAQKLQKKMSLIKYLRWANIDNLLSIFVKPIVNLLSNIAQPTDNQAEHKLGSWLLLTPEFFNPDVLNHETGAFLEPKGILAVFWSPCPTGCWNPHFLAFSGFVS